MSDRSYENKRNINKVQKTLKYELRRREVEAMDKTAEDLEDAVRRHNSKILYWHINKLRGSGQSEIAPVKDRNGPQLLITKYLKKDGWNILGIC